MLTEIISGGQTGVDQAALDVAIDLGIPYSGKCPKGRIDEHGIIPKRFSNLIEISGDFKTEKDNCDARTRKNIEESDGTLIIVPVLPLPLKIIDGTLLTIHEAKKQGKPHLIIDLSQPHGLCSQLIIEWASKYSISKLNIAGPRESNAPGINKFSYDLLKQTLPVLKKSPSIKARL